MSFNSFAYLVQWELLGSLGQQRIPQGDWHAQQPEGCFYSKWPQEGTIILFFSTEDTALYRNKWIYSLLEDCIVFFIFLNPTNLLPPQLLFPPSFISLIPTPYTSSFAIFSLYPPLTCFSLPGPGEQGPGQRKDLSDLSDSESGQDGPERDEQQEVHSGPETTVWSGRYLKSSQYNFTFVEGAANLPIQVVKQRTKY